MNRGLNYLVIAALGVLGTFTQACGSKNGGIPPGPAPNTEKACQMACAQVSSTDTSCQKVCQMACTQQACTGYMVPSSTGMATDDPSRFQGLSMVTCDAKGVSFWTGDQAWECSISGYTPQKCTSNSDCNGTDICGSDMTCQACTPAGMSCGDSSECCTGNVCGSGTFACVACVQTGDPCATDGDCCSGTCNTGSCG